MAFYMGEIRKRRRDFFEAYRNGEYQLAIALGRNLLQLYIEHDDCDCMEYAVDMSNLALAFDQCHLYERAAHYYKKAAALKKEYGGESLSYADTLNNLAIACHMMERHEEARGLHHKVLEIREQRLGKTHPDTIHSLYHLGNTYALQGKTEEAIGFYQTALRQARHCEGFDLLDLADLHDALARVYDRIGNFKKAIYYDELCLDLVEKSRGSGSFAYMVQTLTLAAVCEKAGLLDLAVEYCEKAIDVRRELMSEDHLDFINSLNSLAAICCKNKQFDKAIALHREAMVRIEKMLGKGHIFYADALNNLSADYAGKGEFEEALALNQQALQQKRALLGEDDPQVAAALMSMGALHENMGQTADALHYYEAALAIRRQQNGGKNTACADTLTAIGKAYERQGRYDKAAYAVREALELRRACGDESSGMYVWCLHLLAEISREQGAHTQAIELCRLGQSIMRKRYGASHPHYAAALEKLGLVYETAGELEQAADALEQTAVIRRETLDDDNPLYLNTLEALARVRTKQKRFTDAIALYREKNDVNFEETPQEQRAAATVLLAIANCYKMAQEDARAEAYFAEAEAKLARSGLEADALYEKRRRIYFAGQAETLAAQAPPQPTGDREADARRALEYYSALALSVRQREGESEAFLKTLLKTAALHAALGNRADTETLLDRVLVLGGQDGVFTPSFGRLCDQAGRIYAEAGSAERAESLLRQAYQIHVTQGKCMTKEGQLLLLRLLREKGDETAYEIVKNGGKLE